MRLLLCALIPLLATAQPTIGVIDIYGAHKVKEADIRKVLAIQEGGTLPGSKGDMQDRLGELPGVVDSDVSAVCCDEGKIVLYIGLEEKGAPHFNYRDEPLEDVSLPPELAAAHGAFLVALQGAVRAHHAEEDLSAGHSMMADPKVRGIQESFRELAASNLPILRKVLRDSKDSEQRAMAAHIIGYAPDKAQIIDDLQIAVRDPDEGVRNNAMRSLGAIAVLAQRKPELRLKISPTWFIEMLNSVIWTDRNKAVTALTYLTEGRDPLVLDQLRERSLPALTEMAAWKHLPHALPAYIVLGRVKGIPEAQLQESWSKGDRDFVIKMSAASEKRSTEPGRR